MSNELTYFNNHLETLYINCFQGILHIKVWEDLDHGLHREKNLYRKFNFFWLTTLKAQLEAAQLHLLKLFDNHKKSVTIDRLIEYAEKNKGKLFRQGDLEFIENEIRDFR